MIKIKLCGLRRSEDIEAVNALLPDYAGFILAAGFRRTITLETAWQLRKKLAPGIRAVGVFVNNEIPWITELVKTGLIDVVQLHGRENIQYLKALRESLAAVGKPDTEIIKAFRIDSEEAAKAASYYPSDHILVDSGTGTGQVFDWELLKYLERPFILAGGLSADNIADALAVVKPYGVDVSSGIETDGVKDAAKMERFVCAVRTAQKGIEHD